MENASNDFGDFLRMKNEKILEIMKFMLKASYQLSRLILIKFQNQDPRTHEELMKL